MFDFKTEKIPLQTSNGVVAAILGLDQPHVGAMEEGEGHACDAEAIELKL
jgi:hypothetical protein